MTREMDAFIQYLWDGPEQASVRFLLALAAVTPPPQRCHFANDMVDMLAELKSSGMDKEDMASRVIQEVRQSIIENL